MFFSTSWHPILTIYFTTNHLPGNLFFQISFLSVKLSHIHANPVRLLQLTQNIICPTFERSNWSLFEKKNIFYGIFSLRNTLRLNFCTFVPFFAGHSPGHLFYQSKTKNLKNGSSAFVWWCIAYNFFIINYMIWLVPVFMQLFSILYQKRKFLPPGSICLYK
jgi:hypothetical protein